MNIQARLVLLNFLQFFIWGCWLITIGAYWFQYKQWDASQFGAIFSTIGFSAILMPPLTGIIVDKWLNAEKLLGILHIVGAFILFYIPQVSSPETFFWVLLLYMLCYMPTISLAITVGYTSLKKEGFDVIKKYPPIRAVGTIGFIVAMWVISFSGFETSPYQFYVSAIASLVLGLYAWTLPACPPLSKNIDSKSFIEAYGLDAFKLFKIPKMAIFFLFAMLLGVCLQLTNAYGDTFIHDFASIPEYQNTFAVKYPAFILSLSQFSETVFILAIPFFLYRFGIKYVMLFSMIAWVLRFALFAYGNPGDGLWMIILSCIVYGMAFDFFNISGSLFIETSTDEKMRGSAQGLFMMMANGFGAVFGSLGSGYLIQHYYTSAAGVKDWHGIWMAFATYALIIGVLFFILFKHKHNPEELKSSQIQH